MYASTAAIIQLVAIMPDNSMVVLFDNEAVNSCFGTIPIQYAWISESMATSMALGANLNTQNSELQSCKVEFEGTELEVDFMGFPCLADSKTKVVYFHIHHIYS